MAVADGCFLVSVDVRKEVVLGSRHGSLVITAEAEPIPGRKKSKTVMHRAVQCRCDCGNVVIVKLSNLPKTFSCGCLKRETMRVVAAERFTLHGASHHPLFKLWRHIMDRCENPADKSYPDYGGRGISLCERWHDPWLFIQDLERELGPQPPGRTPGGMPLYSLNRIDNDGNYESGKTWNGPTGRRR